MSDPMTVALITGGATVLCQVLIAVSSSSKTIWRINQLEDKVNKHNNLIERMYKVEERSKSNSHRIDELEHGA